MLVLLNVLSLKICTVGRTHTFTSTCFVHLKFLNDRVGLVCLVNSELLCSFTTQYNVTFRLFIDLETSGLSALV